MFRVIDPFMIQIKDAIFLDIIVHAVVIHLGSCNYCCLDIFRTGSIIIHFRQNSYLHYKLRILTLSHSEVLPS